MAERYTRVFSQQGQFYCSGAPVVIVAGALLKDTQTSKIIAQIKFRNISPKAIRALSVKILAKDISGADVEGVDSFQYLDLNVHRDEEFGAKIPIVLPDATARVFSCECVSAVFTDGTHWKCDESAQWTVLPLPTLLKDKIGTDLAEQYQRDTNTKSKYKAINHSDLWYCGCSALNRNSEGACHRCHAKKVDLFTALNINTLKENKKKYDAEVAALKAEEEKIALVQAKKQRKIAIIAVSAVALLITLILLITKVIIPATAYKNATALLNDGDYISAEEAFLALEEYKDSETMVLECRHRAMCHYLSVMDFENAKLYAQTLGDYEITQKYLLEVVLEAIEEEDYGTAYTVNDMLLAKEEYVRHINESLYQKAIVYYNEQHFDQSNPIFTYLNGYKDSEEKIHTHEYVSSVIAEATCEQEGKQKEECLCGSVVETAIPAKGHNYAEATCTKPKTCIACTKEEGESLGHTTDNGICDRCKQDFRKPPATQEQLQGVWRARNTLYDDYYEEYRISGNYVVYKRWNGSQPDVYWAMTGTLVLTKSGFKVSGQLNKYDAQGNLLIEDKFGNINHVYISYITSTLFVDTFDDAGDVTYYKQ